MLVVVLLAGMATIPPWVPSSETLLWMTVPIWQLVMFVSPELRATSPAANLREVYMVPVTLRSQMEAFFV